MNISLDTNLAKQGSGGSSRIDTSGKYVGAIQYAKTWVTDNGATMVGIRFESDNGQETSIRICTHNRQGEPIFGFKQIQAIMACCKLRNLTAVEATVKDFNFDSGQMEDMTRTIYKELSGARVGLVLQRHDQDKYNDPGQSTFSMDIVAPFNAESEQMADELLDQMPPRKLEKIVTNLKDRDSRGKSKGDFGQQQGQPVGYDNFDDDSIPF